MKKVLVIFVALLVNVACKQQQPLDAATMPGDAKYDGMTVPKERAYTESELIIGRRICAALKSKRLMFEGQADQKEQIRLKGENRSCEGTVYNSAEFTVKLSTASSSNLEYVAINRNNYLSEVITDQSGAMKVICDNMSVSDSVSNTFLSGSSYIIVNILISGGFDRIEISKKTKSSSGDYPLVSLEGVNIFTQDNQIDSKFFGVEQERTRFTACSNSKNTAYIKQKWVKALTSF